MTFESTYTKENLPAEADRFRLVIAEVCPFCQRATIAHHILGLEDTISIGIADSVKTDGIWQFTLDENGEDPVLGAKSVKELYLNTVSDYDQAFSVPALIDTTDKTVANDESLELIRLFNDEFKAFHSEDAPNLSPEELIEDIDRWNKNINNRLLLPFYQIGRTNDQAEYDKRVKRVFKFLETLDEQVAGKEYFFGDKITETDIVLYAALIRYYLVYYYKFKVNLKSLREFENLWPYMQRLYQIPAFKETTNVDAIKKGYWIDEHNDVVPIGPSIEPLENIEK